MGMYRHSFWAGMASVFAGLLCQSVVHAQQVQPMSVELSPLGSQSSTVMQVRNTTSREAFYNLSVLRMMFDADGNEQRETAEDDFLIFPPQFRLEAGQTQTIRIRYVGDPELIVSAPYRVSVSQVPLEQTEKDRTGVELRFAINTLVHVIPQRAQVAIEVLEVSEAADGQWQLVLQNNGLQMARLTRTSWRLTSDDRILDLSRREVSGMIDKNFLMPGATLTVTIPAVEGFDADSTSVSISSPS